MAYFIFSKNSDNIEGTLYRIAENQSDLNNLSIIQSDYKIIEDSQINFDAVKYGTKDAVKYDQNIITYVEGTSNFIKKSNLDSYVNSYKLLIQSFLRNNENHTLFNKWNDYYNQLNNLNLDSIQYPLNKSLEQYFKDQNLSSLNPLQIP